jgi:hypothetical protein
MSMTTSGWERVGEKKCRRYVEPANGRLNTLIRRYRKLKETAS